MPVGVLGSHRGSREGPEVGEGGQTGPLWDSHSLPGIDTPT